MSAKYYCDACQREILVVDPSPFFKLGGIIAQVSRTPRSDMAWGGGHICHECIRSVVAYGKVVNMSGNEINGPYVIPPAAPKNSLTDAGYLDRVRAAVMKIVSYPAVVDALKQYHMLSASFAFAQVIIDAADAVDPLRKPEEPNRG